MPILDGKEITSLAQMITAFQNDPELGKTTLRIQTRWDGTLTSRLIPSDTIQGSGGACLYAEELLEVLGKCLVFDLLGHADLKGLTLGSLHVDVSGDIDFAGSAGLDAPAAFTAFRLGIAVETDATDVQLQELADTVRRTSIVARSLEAVPQEITITKAPMATL